MLSVKVPHQKPGILVFANTQRKVKQLAIGHSELAIKTQFKARSSLFHGLYYIWLKCYSMLYTHIIKKCCNVNTARESSNWIQTELTQLPSMHELCMQAQQKLCTHQMFYTELVWHLQTRREAWIYQNQNTWWQYTNFQSSRFLTSSPPLQLPANLSGITTTKTDCPRMHKTSLTDRLPWSWECGSWEVACKENVSKHRAPRATQLLTWVSSWSFRQLGYFQTTFHTKFFFQVECWNSQSIVNSKVLLLFCFRINSS